MELAGNPVFLTFAALYTLGIIYVAYRGYKETKSEDDFWVAGRSLGWYATAMTLFATTISGAGYFGAAGSSVNIGLAFLWLNFGSMFGLFLFHIIIGPKLWYVGKRHNLYTVSEFITKRFENSEAINRILALGSAVFVSVILYGQFKATGIVMEVLTGVPYVWAIVMALGALTLYTIFGGMKAVVWTDVIQGTIMVLGTFALIFVPISRAGGFTAMNVKLQTLAPQTMTWHGTYSIGFALSWIVLYMSAYNSSPYQVQRAFMAKGFSTFKNMMPVAMIAYFCTNTMKFSGLASRVLIAEGTMPAPPTADYLFPYLVTHLLPLPIAAVLMTAALAAIMSTGDSLLMNVSTVLTNEVYRRYFRPKADAKQLVKVSQIIIGAISALMLIFALVEYKSGISIPIIYMIVQTGMGGLAALYLPGLLYGLFWKRATKTGVIVSQIAGFFTVIAAFVVRNGYAGQALQQAYYVSPLTLGGFHEGALGVVVGLVLLPLISLVTKAPDAGHVKEWFPAKAG